MADSVLQYDDIEDYRFNPFTNTITPKTIGYGAIPAEVRTIPNAFPYQIKLFESPQENIPSTTRITLVVGGTELIEVSKTTTPGDGEYRVNYDEEGNGIADFAPAQKGLQVSIQYYGLGALFQKITLDSRVPSTGNTTIYDVKTFDELPLVPTTDPTLDTQAISKKYLDDNYYNLDEYIFTIFGYLGNTYNIAGIGAGVAKITALTESRIAYIDTVNDDLRTYQFSGAFWAQVGNDLNIAGVNTPALTALSSTRIAFFDEGNDDLRTYDFDGTDWAQVGNDLNIAGSGFPALTALSSSRVAFIDFTNKDLRTYDFDGTDWAQVGNDLNIAGVGDPALAALSSTRIAFYDSVNNELRTYDFDGTDWAQVGVSLSLSATGIGALTKIDENRVAFTEGNIDVVQTYIFDGTNWDIESNNFSVSAAYPSLAYLGSNKLAFMDRGTGNLHAILLGVTPKHRG